MIRIHNGIAQFKGTRVELLSEFMTLAKSFIDEGVVDRRDLQLYFTMAISTDEEIKNAIKETVDEMDDMSEALKLLQTIM